MIPPCIWLCVTLFWPPGTGTVRYSANSRVSQTSQNLFLGFYLEHRLLLKKQSKLFLSKGGADRPEMRSAHHRPRVGARALRAGDGPGASLHDQEGPHQHRRAGSETASAAREILLCETPRLQLDHEAKFRVKVSKGLPYLRHLIIFAEERDHHRCRGVGVGCCTTAAELWQSGNCRWLMLVTRLTSCLLDTVSSCSLVYR